jgi:hypothetical protein
MSDTLSHTVQSLLQITLITFLVVKKLKNNRLFPVSTMICIMLIHKQISIHSVAEEKQDKSQIIILKGGKIILKIAM